jgi:hypothetical protein
MGFFDAIKGAVQAVTGGAAKVTLEFGNQIVFPGDLVPVRITVLSQASGPLNSKGLFIDFVSNEALHLTADPAHNIASEIKLTNPVVSQQFQTNGPFALNPGQSEVFQGQFQVPAVQPTYAGPHAKHDIMLRARMDVTGNDPDSGWHAIRVGQRQ